MVILNRFLRSLVIFVTGLRKLTVFETYKTTFLATEELKLRRNICQFVTYISQSNRQLYDNFRISVLKINHFLMAFINRIY